MSGCGDLAAAAQGGAECSGGSPAAPDDAQPGADHDPDDADVRTPRRLPRSLVSMTS
jgi:hypothetical protein